MAKVKIEPSGCCINKGWIQVRLSMYLEPTDPRYNEHHVFVVDETSRKWLNGYKGVVDTMGSPVDQANYDAWIDSLPHIWRDNPFNNHFIYVDETDSNATILLKIEAAFTEFFNGWSQYKEMEEVWHSKARPQLVSKTLTLTQITAANTRLTQIKAMVI